MPRALATFTFVWLLSTLAPGQLTLSVTQPTGPGSFSMIVTGAAAGAELYNLVSVVPHVPTGGGPIFGLGLGGSSVLLEQLAMPLGTDPFHVNADVAGDYELSFTLAVSGLPCLAFDCVAVELTPLAGVVTSPVVAVCLDF